MWETITGWFAAFFNYFRPQRADFEAVYKTQNEVIAHQSDVINSLQERINTMDTEFHKAMERRDAEITHSTARINVLEKSEENCRRKLDQSERLQAKQQTEIYKLQGLVKRLMSERDEMETVKALRDDPDFKDRQAEHTKKLVEEAKETKVDP